MITVSGSESISAVEKYLEQLVRKSGQCDLKLPTRLRDDRFGGKAALVQLILTWARHCKKSCLITHVQRPEQASVQLRNLAAEDHGLIALLAATNLAGLRGQLLDTTPLAQSIPDYDQVYRRGRLKGSSSFFLIADHLTDSTTDCFYDHLSVLDAIRAERKQSFIREVFLRIETCIGRSRASRLTAEQKKSMGEIIYELFSNTERWGQHDAEWRQLQPSLRGILIQIHSDADKYSEGATGSPPIEKYLDAILPTLGSNPTLLEVSIFDSGVGLAQRILEGRPLSASSLVEEHDAVLRCLILHGTSSGDETEGIGLYHILKLLSRHEGFLRYRGGRLSLYRDFKEHPYLPEKYESRSVRRTGRSTERDTAFRKDSSFLVDWASGSLQATKMIPVEGALFTILLPLPAARKPPEQLDLLSGEAT